MMVEVEALFYTEVINHGASFNHVALIISCPIPNSSFYHVALIISCLEVDVLTKHASSYGILGWSTLTRSGEM
jgi:hypothetical protein